MCVGRRLTPATPRSTITPEPLDNAPDRLRPPQIQASTADSHRWARSGEGQRRVLFDRIGSSEAVTLAPADSHQGTRKPARFRKANSPLRVPVLPLAPASTESTNARCRLIRNGSPFHVF